MELYGVAFPYEGVSQVIGLFATEAEAQAFIDGDVDCVGYAYPVPMAIRQVTCQTPTLY